MGPRSPHRTSYHITKVLSSKCGTSAIELLACLYHYHERWLTHGNEDRLHNVHLTLYVMYCQKLESLHSGLHRPVRHIELDKQTNIVTAFGAAHTSATLHRHSVVTAGFFPQCAVTGFSNFTFTFQSIDCTIAEKRKIFHHVTMDFDI